MAKKQPVAPTPLSEYEMRIYHNPTQTYVAWPPGLNFEKDLVQEIADRVVEKGVGYLRSSARVREAVVTAMQEALRARKKMV